MRANWAGWIWLALTGVGPVACNAPDDLPELSGLIEGKAHFTGPLPGVAVELWATDATGGSRERVAETVTDGEGRYRFSRRDGVAWYRVEAVLDGHPWTVGGLTGTFGTDDRLVGLTSLDSFSAVPAERERVLVLSPMSTLLVALADAHRAGGETQPLALANESVNVWLGLDVLTTWPGAQGVILDDGGQFTLLLDAFDALSERLGDAHGAQVTPPELLRALRLDAAGHPAATLDGAGPDGQLYVGDAPLGPQTLQGELAAAVGWLLDQPDRGWSSVEPRAVRALVERLRCSNARAFPACEPEALHDATPPSLISVTPAPGMALSGIVEFAVAYAELDSAIAAVSLVGAHRADRPYQVQDNGRYLVDTREVVGADTVELRTRAQNDSGVWSDWVTLRYPVVNLGEGELGGVVVGGGYVKVVARNTEGEILAETVSRETGGFMLALNEYRGPVMLEAIGGERSTFGVAEAPRPWGAAHSLRAMFPDFEPGVRDQRINVSVWSDLALNLAVAQAERAGTDLGWAHARVVESLGKHLGLDAPVESLLRGRPAPIRAARGVGDAERLLLAHGGLSQMAQDQNNSLGPLQITELFRQDAADGVLDGRQVDLPVVRDGLVLVADPLRNPFTSAVARWLLGPGAATGLRPDSVARWLESAASNTDPVLFDPDQRPRPHDAEGPRLALLVDGAAVDDVLPVGGVVEVSAHSEDPSGVVEVLLEVPELGPALTRMERGDVGPQRVDTWRLDPTALADGLEGAELGLRCTATDGLGQRTVVELKVRPDRQPPVLSLTLPAGQEGPTRWHTNTPFNSAPLPLTITTQDASAVRVAVDFDDVDQQPFRLLDGPLDGELSVDLPVHLREPGEWRLTVVATDAVGHSTQAVHTVVVDRTPPQVGDLLAGAYFDERQAPASQIAGRLDLNRVPAMEWPAGAERIPLHKTQVTLGPDDRNPVVLRWDIADDRTPAALLETALDDEPAEDVVLTAGALGFDPLSRDLPDDGAVWQGQVTVRDLAGNSTTVATPEITQHILPPPPIIGPFDPQSSAVPIEALDWDTLNDALEHGVRLAAFRLTNPWGLRIFVRLARPAQTRFVVDAPVVPEAPWHRLEGGQDWAALGAPRAERYDRVVYDLPECMYAGGVGGRRLDTTRAVLATGHVQGREMVVRGEATCRALVDAPFEGAVQVWAENPLNIPMPIDDWQLIEPHGLSVTREVVVHLPESTLRTLLASQAPEPHVAYQPLSGLAALGPPGRRVLFWHEAPLACFGGRPFGCESGCVVDPPDPGDAPVDGGRTGGGRERSGVVWGRRHRRMRWTSVVDPHVGSC